MTAPAGVCRRAFRDVGLRVSQGFDPSFPNAKPESGLEMHYPGLRAGNGERGTEEELVGAIGGAANQQHFSSEARDLEELAWNDTWMMTNPPEQSTAGNSEADTWTTMGASHGNASLADFESWSESGSSGRATTGTILPVVSESSYFSDAPANLMSDEPGAYYDLAPPSADAGSSSDSGTFFTESSAVGSSTEASDNESESMSWDDEAFNPYVDPFLSVNEQQVLRPPVHETTRHPLGALPPAELSTAALPLGWGVGATGMDERALDREASTGSSIASHPAAATKKEIMVALPSQVAAPLAVSAPLTATEATAATADKADQIKYALEHIIERPTSREQRQQVWKWAEMLLATDDVEFMRRPRIMPHPFGVYREDSPSTRRSRKSDTDVPDKWQNSGGLRGEHCGRWMAQCLVYAVSMEKLFPKGNREAPLRQRRRLSAIKCIPSQQLGLWQTLGKPLQSSSRGNSLSSSRRAIKPVTPQLNTYRLVIQRSIWVSNRIQWKSIESTAWSLSWSTKSS